MSEDKKEKKSIAIVGPTATSGIVKGAEKQSVNPGEGPPVIDITGRGDMLANIDHEAISRQAQTPTVSIHATDKTFDNKPLSTAHGKDVTAVKKKEE